VPSTNPLGLTPVDQNIINVAFGAGHPLMYFEVGFSVSACFGQKIHEKDFRPRFFRACRHGFVTYTSWEELYKNQLARKVIEAPRGVQAIRDLQIFMGGDYDYYKNFDPYTDYEKNPEAMDRFMKGKVGTSGGGRPKTRDEIFRQQYENHKRDPNKFKWPPK